MIKNSLQIENSKLKIIFFGTPDFVIPIAKSLSQHFDLLGVVTSPDAPAGQKKVITPSPVKQWFMEYLLKTNKEGIILTPDTLDNDVAIKLRKLHPDLFVVAAYGKLIPKKILDIPHLGALNVHPSRLPLYRGPSPIQQALLDGKKTLGIAIIKMDQELDHGPLLTQWEIPIETSDTLTSLHVKAFEDTSKKFPLLINDYQQGNLKLKEQNHKEATFSKKITKQDGYFDIDNPPSPETLQRMIKAYYPWPTAWTKVRTKNHESRIMKFLPNGYVQMEGKNQTKLKELLNGYPELQEKITKLSLDS